MSAVLESIEELKTKTLSIESLIGSLAQPVTKKQVVEARRVAKFTVKDLSNLNIGLRNLLKKGSE